MDDRELTGSAGVPAGNGSTGVPPVPHDEHEWREAGDTRDSGDTPDASGPISKSRPQSGEIGSCPRNPRSSIVQTVLACLALALLVMTACAWFFGTRLTVLTTPPGCTAFINGRVAGATPVALNGLATGNYCLRLERDGFEPVVRVVTVPHQGLTVVETLTPCGAGSLLVRIKPQGAEVLLDGEILGHTPLQKTDVPAGMHELMVRKTNHKPFIQRIEVRPGEPLEYKGFALENIILSMLRANIEKEKQSVRQYMDLGHYLFVNDELDEAAEVYVKAQEVAATPLEFGPEISVEERGLAHRLRAEDVNRLAEEIKRKKNWSGKDLSKFRRLVDQGQELAAGKNVTEWVAVREMAANFIQDEKYERAQALLLQHIAAVSKPPQPPQVALNLPQAYIELLLLRLRMHNLEGARETNRKFFELYGADATYLRQAANGVYNVARLYQGTERAEVLAFAEQMLRQGTKLTVPGRGDPELHALCKFELANVLCQQGRAEQALNYYHEAIAGTKDAGTKELRTFNLVECFKTLHNLREARARLSTLAASPRAEIANRAKEELARLTPAPEKK